MTDQEQRKLEYEYALAMGVQDMLLKLKNSNPTDGRYGKCIEFALVQTTFLVNDMDRVVMGRKEQERVMRQFNVGDKFKFYQRNDNGSVVRCMDGFISAIHGVNRFSHPSLWVYDFILENCGVEGSFYFGESNKLCISRLEPFLKWELADAAEVSGEEADHA